MNKELNKIVSFKDLSAIRVKHPSQTIVHCHGIFDLLHHGHLLHLHSAKAFGDLLVVTVTPDRYVNKGPGRPRFNERKRVEMLAALEIVDYVAINQTPKAVEPILELKPDYYVKGPDYRKKEEDITGGIFEEEQAVKQVGGELRLTGDETESATELINRFFHEWEPVQKQTIESIKMEVGFKRTLSYIDALKGLKVLVVGEPIIDTYVFCNPENLSSKSQCISANFIKEENYPGGSLAVARHLDALGCHVTLVAPSGAEDRVLSFMEGYQKGTNIDVLFNTVPGLKTPRKIRYISPFMYQRMFELTYLNVEGWAISNINGFSDLISESSEQADAVLVLDFGHGLWENTRLEQLKHIKAFTCLNVQTNSGNYGYNLFHKHRHFDYLVLDERELRLGMHERLLPANELAKRAFNEKIRSPFSLTLGQEGSVYFDASGNVYQGPAYFLEPVDTTGAGDAFFALTSMLVSQGVPSLLVPFLGNIFAGLKTKIIGNKHAVKRVDFIRTVTALLK